MNFNIRKTRLEDMAGVMDAHRRSILELCSKDYRSDQIQAWANINYSKDIWQRNVESEFHYVVERENQIEGFCHARIHENGIGEIQGLYFTNKISGLGIGRKIFEHSMKHFYEHKCPRVQITGTKTAKGFYEKMGFRVIEESVIPIRGVDVECFRMELILSSV